MAKSDIIIKTVPIEKGALKKFVQFGIDLYDGNDYYVPPLVIDEVNTFLPDKNPAMEFCQERLFMAYRDGKPVGRIAGIINDSVNERTGEKTVRFGFVDFIDDDDVVDALFKAVEDWGKSKGMDKMVGPMGFTDMDHEGMLTMGYDEMGTMATIYNYPYYVDQVERLGFEKEIDYVEYLIKVPEEIPDKFKRIADIVAKRYELRPLLYTSRKKLKEDYGLAIFDLLNEAYDKLYGFSPLTKKQIEYYIDMYLGILRLNNVCLIVDKEDKLVGFGIAMPNMSEALRKSKGKLMPTGWWYLWRALQGHSDRVDLLLVAVKPELQNLGVNALLFGTLIPEFNKDGYKYAESNVELEDNESVQKQWAYFDKRMHRRRRVFKKMI